MHISDILILLGFAITIVVCFKYLKLSPVLGYLVAGAVIGDYGFNIVPYEQTHFLGEFGIVFFLFVIGLSLSFEKLKTMRKYVLGLGSLQMLTTTVLIGGVVSMLSEDSSLAIIVGGGLALSSTAIVMQIIEENNSSSTQLGRLSLSILLQQDLLVVPLLVIVPLLTTSTFSIGVAIGIAFLKATLALVVIFAIGKLLLKPLFSLISSGNTSTNNEIFIAATLFIALASAYLTDYAGVSKALGAFIAGVLVAETEFRNAAEKSIGPFKGLLLGLFFMSVGMKINIHDIYLDINKIIIFSIALILLKSLIIYSLSLLFGFTQGMALHAGLLLSQGGEFAFILFKLGKDSEIIPDSTYRTLIMIVTSTMAVTPLLSKLAEKLAERLDGKIKKPVKLMEFGAIDLTDHVIIAGFGQVGKMAARLLAAQGISYIGIDVNDKIVAESVEAGFPVFVGDVAQHNTLKAVGADRAASLILATDNEVTIKKALWLIATKFPELITIVRTHDLSYANDLYDLGATTIIPEDFEVGLQLSSVVLKMKGVSEYEISCLKKQFRDGNYVVADGDEDESDEI